MSEKKVKVTDKVLGEVFDDDRVRNFLNGEPPQGISKDFFLLERAYRGMKIENFQTFVQFFKEAGYDLEATNQNGKTLADLIATHRHGKAYLAAINS